MPFVAYAHSSRLRWVRAKIFLVGFALILIAIYSMPLAFVLFIIAFHYYLHKTNPYTVKSLFQQPYSTSIDTDGSIRYQQEYTFKVYGGKAASLFGYYVSGFLIAKNTLLGGKPAEAKTETGIIEEIHSKRFNPCRPYLISGDQFSVLYPRICKVRC